MATPYPFLPGWQVPSALGLAASVGGVDRVEAARELGVSVAAPGDLVEKAFRRAARAHHPDVGGDAGAFRRATEARSVLLRPGPPDPLTWVVDAIVRHHPAVRLLEALARAVDRRIAPR